MVRVSISLVGPLSPQVDQEKDVLERLCEVRETVAPRHMEKVTLEDDIGMIHELTQVGSV